MITGYYHESPIVFQVSRVKRRKEEKIVSSTVKILRWLQRTSCLQVFVESFPRMENLSPRNDETCSKDAAQVESSRHLGTRCREGEVEVSLDEFAMKPLHTRSVSH